MGEKNWTAEVVEINRLSHEIQEELLDSFARVVRKRNFDRIRDIYQEIVHFTCDVAETDGWLNEEIGRSMQAG